MSQPTRSRGSTSLIAGVGVARHRAAGRRCSRCAIRLESPGPPDLHARPASARTARRSRSTSCARWSAAPSSPAPGWRSRRATTGSRASARSCAATRSTSCRTCGTCCAARCRSSARARRCRSRSSSTPSASAAGSRSSPGSPAGRRSTAAPRCRGPSGSSSTSGTSSTARSRSTSRSSPGPCGWCSPARASTRERRADGSRRRVGVLLTGVGKRYDIVSAFAQHATVVAADPEPAGAGAVRRPPPPRGAADRRPRRTCPALRGAVRASTTSAPSCRSPTSTSRCSAHARAAGELPAFVARPRDRPRDVRQVRDAPAARAPRPAVAADRAARASRSSQLPGDGQAAPGLRRALDPPRRRRRARPSSSSTTSTSRRWSSADGRPRVLDRLPVATSTGAA